MKSSANIPLPDLLKEKQTNVSMFDEKAKKKIMKKSMAFAKRAVRDGKMTEDQIKEFAQEIVVLEMFAHIALETKKLEKKFQKRIKAMAKFFENAHKKKILSK